MRTSMALAVGLIAVASACGGSTSGGAASSTAAAGPPPSEERLQAALVVQTDLGVDWVVDTIPTTRGSAQALDPRTVFTGVLCGTRPFPPSLLKVFPSNPVGGSSRFKDDKTGGIVSEVLFVSTSPDLPKVIDDIKSTMAACRSATPDAPTGAVGSVEFSDSPVPAIGDQSASIRQTVFIEKARQHSDLILARRGSVLVLLAIASVTGGTYPEELHDADLAKISAAANTKLSSL